MKTKSHRASTVDASEFDALLLRSRDRALAAREAAELTAEQAASVGGGLALGAYVIDRPFPRGVLPFLKFTDTLTTAVTPAELTMPGQVGF